MQAYRCKFPPELMDCPVLKILKETQSCVNCKHEKSWFVYILGGWF
jgi:hypothetical protein